MRNTSRSRKGEFYCHSGPLPADAPSFSIRLVDFSRSIDTPGPSESSKYKADPFYQSMIDSSSSSSPSPFVRKSGSSQSGKRKSDLFDAIFDGNTTWSSSAAGSSLPSLKRQRRSVHESSVPHPASNASAHTAFQPFIVHQTPSSRLDVEAPTGGHGHGAGYPDPSGHLDLPFYFSSRRPTMQR